MSKPPPPRGPRAALDALLADAAGHPVRRAQWLGTVDLLLRPHLPPSLAAHARLANVDGARLVFVVDSPLWNAKLRLAAPTLLDAARANGLDVAELVVKTTTQPLFPPPQVEPTARPLSATASEGLRAALASLRRPEDGNGSSDGS